MHKNDFKIVQWCNKQFSRAYGDTVYMMFKHAPYDTFTNTIRTKYWRTMRRYK